MLCFLQNYRASRVKQRIYHWTTPLILYLFDITVIICTLISPSHSVLPNTTHGSDLHHSAAYFHKIKFYRSTFSKFIQLNFLFLALTSCFSGSPMLLPMTSFLWMNGVLLYWTMLPLHTGQHTEDESTPWLWWMALYYILGTAADFISLRN